MGIYTFPLSVQITLPDHYFRDEETKKQLSLISERKLVGVEVNFSDPEKLNFNELRRFLEDFDLRMTFFASGLTAKIFGLSLSAVEEDIRIRSVDMMKNIIEGLSGGDSGKGIIVGFFKGGPGTGPEKRNQSFRQSMEELIPFAEQAGVTICVEATNRYESCVGNTLNGTRKLLDGLFNGALEILPDTFHMNIEENDMAAALEGNKDFYHSIHLSDNNRYLPGFGAINFEEILRHLKKTGYKGGMALEGNIRNDFASDLIEATTYLENVQRRMEKNV
jgi:sugar phosphate isomerase/epimerase